MILALAQAEGVHFARAQHHQLETMRRRLSSDGEYQDALARLTWLESFATTFRYPKTLGGIAEPPSREKLQLAVSETDALLQRMAGYFDVDLDPASTTPASHSRSPKRP